MEIIWYHPSQSAAAWINGLQQRLPQARVRAWQPEDNGPADYALVRSPPQKCCRDAPPCAASLRWGQAWTRF